MMKILFCISFLLIVVSHAFNGQSNFPQRTLFLGGYYGRPSESKSYIPADSLTFAAGDTIATNSFVRNQPSTFDVLQISSDETMEKRWKDPVSFDDELEYEKTTTAKPKLTPKSKPAIDEENEEKDVSSSSWPFTTTGASSYNAFFPILIGGMTRTRGLGRKTTDGDSSSGETFYPGSATAIANSFSTGKGGVATSHATSFGDPYLSTLFRNGNLDKKKTIK